MPSSDLFWMKEAYQLAKVAEEQGEVPIGALIIDEQQRIIGRGWNQVLQKNDPTAHAEIVALREAALYLNNYRVENTTLYVTLEPCCMCASALVHARIKRLVFAARDVRVGAAGSYLNLLSGAPFNHQVHIDEGPLQQECSLLLTHFFKTQR